MSTTDRQVVLKPTEPRQEVVESRREGPLLHGADGIEKDGHAELETNGESSADDTKTDVEQGGGGASLQQVASVYAADTLSRRRQFIFVATICTAMFTTQCALGNTLATVHVIGDSLGATEPGQLSWLIAGYSLTVGTFILVGGRLGDEFGNKRLYVAGMAWFALWSLVAGLAVYARHVVLFVFARVFQGMGPAMTLPNGLALFGKSYAPGPRRNMAFAWFGASAPLGALCGFLFGGLFALVWWPWIYWSLAIALACMAVLGARVIPPIAPAEKKAHTLGRLWHDLDIPGSLTGVTALVLFNFAWNQAVVVGWRQPYVYVCLVVSLLFVAAFFLIELTHAEHPLLPLAAFNSDIAFVFAGLATGWACFGIWVFYHVQIAIEFSGATPLQVAAWFAPIVVVGIGSAVAVGKLLGGRVRPSWIMVAGQVAYTTGSVLAATLPPDSTYWTYFFFGTSIMVVGMDTSLPAASILFASAVPKRLQGMGASIVMTVVNYSISLGLGFAGTLETNIDSGGSTPADKLRGYRGALWLAVGLAGLGLVLSLVYATKDHLRDRKKALAEVDE